MTSNIKWCHYCQVFVDTMFSRAEICSVWASYRLSWLDPQISVPRISAANCCSPRSLQILHHYTSANTPWLHLPCTTCIHSYSFTFVYSQALQEKLWTMAVPLCLKQNAKVSTAARQVSMTNPNHRGFPSSWSLDCSGFFVFRSWTRRINWSSCTADWRRNRSPRSTTCVCRRKRYSSSSPPDPNEGQRSVANTF